MSSPDTKPEATSAGRVPSSNSMATNIGRGLAKVLQIDLDDEAVHDAQVTRGESVYSNHELDQYYEQEPTVMEWLQQFAPTFHGLVQYVLSLLPFLTWIHRYNWKWGYGDLVAGITVGCVVVPQGSKSVYRYGFCVLC